jgi:hypothetical protein
MNAPPLSLEAYRREKRTALVEETVERCRRGWFRQGLSVSERDARELVLREQLRADETTSHNQGAKA